MSTNTHRTLLSVAFAIVIFYIVLDIAAFAVGRERGKAREWYHFLPGGGIVRLYEATHQDVLNQ